VRPGQEGGVIQPMAGRKGNVHLPESNDAAVADSAVADDGDDDDDDGNNAATEYATGDGEGAT
jgi:hypothetical protein